MKKSVKIKIGEIEYSLKGDESAITKAAELVNSQISGIRNRHSEGLPENTLNVLASLNIAENELKLREKNETNINYVISEIDKISEYLKGKTEAD